THEGRQRLAARGPAPLEAIVRELAEWVLVPCDGVVERGWVARDVNERGPLEEIALGPLALAVPLVLAREGPQRVSGCARRPKLGDESVCNLTTKLRSD